MAGELTREEAITFSRTVGYKEALQGGKLAAMAGSQVVELHSVAEVEDFLQVRTGEELAELGQRARIHHLEPKMLAAWVREVIGDVELADSLEAVADTGKAYGYLVPDLKQLLADRLAQYEEALADAESPEAS